MWYTVVIQSVGTDEGLYQSRCRLKVFFPEEIVLGKSGCGGAKNFSEKETLQSCGEGTTVQRGVRMLKGNATCWHRDWQGDL